MPSGVKKITAFVQNLVRDVLDNELIEVSGEITYKLMLSIFPLITFLLSLLGFLHLDISLLNELIVRYIPESIHALLMEFVQTLSRERNATMLSVSVFIALFSSSSGFRSMMRGINKSYGIKDERPFPVRFAISIALTLVFIAAIIVAIVAIVFRDSLLRLFARYALVGDTFVGFLSYAATFGVIFITTTLIYMISARKRFRRVLPGSLLSVILWLIFTRLFNLYVTTFPAFTLYRGIASTFVMLLWLNIISVIMLVGAQVNANVGK